MEGVGVHLLCSLPEIREIFRHGNVAASMFKQKLATIYSCRIFLLCKWHLITLYGFRSSTLVTRPMLQQRSHAKHSKIFVCGQYILQLNDWSWKIVPKTCQIFKNPTFILCPRSINQVLTDTANGSAGTLTCGMYLSNKVAILRHSGWNFLLLTLEIKVF